VSLRTYCPDCGNFSTTDRLGYCDTCGWRKSIDAPDRSRRHLHSMLWHSLGLTAFAFVVMLIVAFLGWITKP
jgi:hypothetical protein